MRCESADDSLKSCWMCSGASPTGLMDVMVVDVVVKSPSCWYNGVHIGICDYKLISQVSCASTWHVAELGLDLTIVRNRTGSLLLRNLPVLEAQVAVRYIHSWLYTVYYFAHDRSTSNQSNSAELGGRTSKSANHDFATELIFPDVLSPQILPLRQPPSFEWYLRALPRRRTDSRIISERPPKYDSALNTGPMRDFVPNSLVWFSLL